MQNPSLVHLIFALSSLLILLASLGVVLVKNPVRATLLLIASFIPTALIYILLQAPFVGILQILVYAGAIMMLFTFVIMMINPAPMGGKGGEGGLPPSRLNTLVALLLLVLAAVVFIPGVYQAAAQTTVNLPLRPDFGGLGALSEMIFRDPANNPLTVSFELMSFLILVGIIAALNFSRRKSQSRLDSPSETVSASGQVEKEEI